MEIDKRPQVIAIRQHYCPALRPFLTGRIFQEIFGRVGSKIFLGNICPVHDLNGISLSGARCEDLGPSLRAVLMGIKSCTKILIFSTRFSCQNLAVEDFVTLFMGKKSC